ncbi:MAG: family 43 glycosylhydrolase, partial [Nanoarchaeota archaeon]|nr:family 43 glycosylhydrolase [Nanoarchaeota archaeon]
SIGHAVSKDLINWKELPTALKPGKKCEWDDFTLWTGTVIKRKNKFYMFYTGRHEKSKYIQKIGLATSKDLINWEKHADNPLVVADSKYYETANKKNNLGKAGSWRDPSIMQDPKTKKYYMTLSARSSDRKKEYDGCVALAESKDLIEWRVGKPLFYPKIYDEMENTQIVFHKSYYYIFFSIPYKKSYSPSHARKVKPQVGLHCYYSKSLKGKYRPVNNTGVVFPNGEEIYALKVIKQKGDIFTALGWLRKKNGKYLAKLAYPIEFKIDGNEVCKL